MKLSLRQIFTAATVIQQGLTIGIQRKLVAVLEHRLDDRTKTIQRLRATNEVLTTRARELAAENRRIKDAYAIAIATAKSAGVTIDVRELDGPGVTVEDIERALTGIAPAATATVPPISRESKL